MAKIYLKKKHHLDKDHVRQKVQHLADKLSNELSVAYRWQEDRLVFERSGANGHIEVRKDEVEVEIQLGLLFSPLKNSIEKTVSGYLDVQLG
jgi:putative polyhydroxyalkanoate system protein